MPGQEGEAKLKKPKFCWFCILDTWNIINLAFLGKPGGLSIIIEEVTLYWKRFSGWLFQNSSSAQIQLYWVFKIKIHEYQLSVYF